MENHEFFDGSADRTTSDLSDLIPASQHIKNYVQVTVKCHFAVLVEFMYGLQSKQTSIKPSKWYKTTNSIIFPWKQSLEKAIFEGYCHTLQKGYGNDESG